MDEQQTQATYSEPAPAEAWDSEADGLAYNNYEDSPDTDFDADTPASEPEVTMNDDGDLEFTDEFFEGFGEDDEPATPKPYTEDELKATPFEAWDINRLEGDVKDYVPIVRDQMLRRQMEAQLSQRPATPPTLNAPQPYTPSELADAAKKVACERLGLDDPDDFDDYEGEHQAAMKLAMDELSQRRNMEVAQYQRAAQGYQDLQNFNAALVRQPDYMEFDRWFSGKLQEAGVTAQQVNAGLQEYARRSGGDYNSLKGVIAGWYQEFRAERNPVRNVPRGANRVSRPPVLEGAGSSGYEGRGRVNMRNFGNLDEDAQAKALMRMGIV